MKCVYVGFIRKVMFVFALFASFDLSAFPINFQGFGEHLPSATLPLSLARAGAVFVMDLDAGHKTYTYAFYLNFSPADSPQELQRVTTVLGLKESGNGGTYKNGSGQVCLVRTGISVPLRLTISRVYEGGESVVYDRRIEKLWGFGGNGSRVSRLIDFVSLEPAHYKVRLEVLAVVDDLVGVPVRFNVGLPGKH